MTTPSPQPDPQQMVAEGSTLVVSVSGGKDSAAMCLHLRELGLPHTRIFANTGWEHRDTYEYLSYLADELGPIEWLDPERDMVELIRHKGMFPGQTRRYCTQLLKFAPICDYLAELDDPINVVGIRRGESLKRKAALEWEWWDDGDCWVWRPLVEWTEQDVIDIHQRHGLKPNPLYLRGAERVGCWPCIYARKSEIRMIADTNPSRIDKIRQLEAEVQAAAAARYAAKGETFESNGYKPPTFFSLKKKQYDEGGEPIKDENGHHVRKGEMASIDTVVDWSRTVRGGRQYSLFSEIPPNHGCMRWGMCE